MAVVGVFGAIAASAAGVILTRELNGAQPTVHEFNRQIQYIDEPPCSHDGKIRFPGIMVIQTYVSNNGSQATSLIGVQVTYGDNDKIKLKFPRDRVLLGQVLALDSKPPFVVNAQNSWDALGVAKYPIPISANETKQLWFSFAFNYISNIDAIGESANIETPFPSDGFVAEFVFANGKNYVLNGLVEPTATISANRTSLVECYK